MSWFEEKGFVIDFGKVCLITKPTAKKYTSFYHYMAPEVLRGRPVSSSSDVFSLGVIISTIAKTLENNPCSLWENSASTPSQKFDHLSQLL